MPECHKNREWLSLQNCRRPSTKMLALKILARQLLKFVFQAGLYFLPLVIFFLYVLSFLGFLFQDGGLTALRLAIIAITACTPASIIICLVFLSRTKSFSRKFLAL